MKDFQYKILLTNCEVVKEARKWCRKEFGNQPIAFVKWKRIYFGPSYDLKNGIWYNKVSGNSRAFYFKCPIDAMAFKLRWL